MNPLSERIPPMADTDLDDTDMSDDPLMFDTPPDAPGATKSRARQLLRTQADDLDDPEWLQPHRLPNDDLLGYLQRESIYELLGPQRATQQNRMPTRRPIAAPTGSVLRREGGRRLICQ